MTNEKFFDLAYREYQAELELANSIYQRASFLMSACVIIGGASAVISRVELLGESIGAVACLLHIFVMALAIALIGGISFVIYASFPRNYLKMSKIFFWKHWREVYSCELEEVNPGYTEYNEMNLSAETIERILDSLVNCQGTNALTNQKRLQALQRAQGAISIAVLVLLLQGVCALILRMQGV